MLQDYSYKTIRSSAVLTGSYVASTIMPDKTTPPNTDPSLHNQLVLLIGLTLGNLTSAQVKVEFSHDGVTFYQETFSSLSSGTDTMTVGEHSMNATGNFRLALPIKDHFIKVSAKGTGDTTSSLMSIGAVIGVA